MSTSVASANNGLKRFDRKREGVCLLFAFSKQLKSVLVGDVLEACFYEFGGLFDGGGGFACPFIVIQVEKLCVD